MKRYAFAVSKQWKQTEMPEQDCDRCLVGMARIEYLTHDCDFYARMDESAEDWRIALLD